MKQVAEGSQAVSEAVRLAKVQVIAAYPITPQTHIVEELSEYCANGTLNARFICVESEHSAMAALIGAASGGVRTFTATSSHGLAYMHELLHWASGARLPIVMANVNRALGPGWNIWLDQTDSLSQRDTGWIQLYCEDSQDALDTTLIAYRLAESVNLPVMVVLDAFFLSHTYEPVDIPDQKTVNAFLPPLLPRFQLDIANPAAFNQFVAPQAYMEMRYNIQTAMQQVWQNYNHIAQDFKTLFGRDPRLAEDVQCDDAEIIFVTAGTTVSTCRQAVDRLRNAGEKAGLLKLKMFRPFPVDFFRQFLNGKQKVAVVDRNCSFGASGIFAQELRAALYNAEAPPKISGYIAGLGGRDVTPETIEDIYWQTKKADRLQTENTWIGLDPETLKSWRN
ncbi:MAG: transketolase C-terminal domain-containing protein [Deltaproteobacteria bacterium]|jgi:pyruvate/2-oxoacid:ferredoxin oxidoreductase alpha subunit